MENIDEAIEEILKNFLNRNPHFVESDWETATTEIKKLFKKDIRSNYNLEINPKKIYREE